MPGRYLGFGRQLNCTKIVQKEIAFKRTKVAPFDVTVGVP
jgi:hypothetical protein